MPRRVTSWRGTGVADYLPCLRKARPIAVSDHHVRVGVEEVAHEAVAAAGIADGDAEPLYLLERRAITGDPPKRNEAFVAKIPVGAG